MLYGMATALMAVSILPARAQVLTTDNTYFEIIPGRFSATGHPQLTFTRSEANGYSAEIYDDSFTLVKGINFVGSEYKTKVVTEERLVIPGEYTETEEHWSSGTVTGLDEVVELARGWGLESHTKKGSVHTFLPVELPEEGNYHKIVYTEGEDHFIEYNVNRYPKYSDWQVTGETVNTDIDVPKTLWISDYDVSVPGDDIGCVLTQSLFNSDDKYEYLVAVYELNGEPSDNIDQLDGVWQGNEYICIKRRLTYNCTCVRNDVCSEDGQVVASLPGGYINGVFLFGGKTYINIHQSGGDKGGASVIYEINPQSNSVKAVHAGTVKIFPRAAGRGESITVETGAGTAGMRREVVVTAIDGRVVTRVAIPSGETTTRINTSRMGGGVYNFTVVADGKKLENGKIIIR